MGASSSYLQKPLEVVVLALSERVQGWWPDVSKTCAQPHCGGRMYVDPPVHPAWGSLLCHLCGREVAAVIPSRREPYVPRMVICPMDGYRHSEMARCQRCVNREETRRYRAKRRAPAERSCASCGVVSAMPSASRCSRCNRQWRKERAG